jgi:hypothetical protein
MASYTTQGIVGATGIAVHEELAIERVFCFHATYTLHCSCLPLGRYLGLCILASQCLLHHTTLASTRSLPVTPSAQLTLLMLLLVLILALLSLGCVRSCMLVQPAAVLLLAARPWAETTPA